MLSTSHSFRLGQLPITSRHRQYADISSSDIYQCDPQCCDAALFNGNLSAEGMRSPAQYQRHGETGEFIDKRPSVAYRGGHVDSAPVQLPRPKRLGDERGWFTEVYSVLAFETLALPAPSCRITI